MAEEKYTFQSFSKKEESKNVSEQVDQDFTDYQEDSERDYRPIRQNRQGRTGCSITGTQEGTEHGGEVLGIDRRKIRFQMRHQLCCQRTEK